jgi:O-antigen chain-terminating methyltransferase
VEVDRLLMKESGEANKRLREITAYLSAENGWFDGVMAAFSQVHRSLQRRIDNQYSLETRLLAVDNKVAETRTEARRRQLHVQDAFERIIAARTAADDAHANTDNRLTALNDRLNEGTKAGEALARRVEDLKAALASETKARAAMDDQVSGQHARLDGLSGLVQELRRALSDEYKAREAVAERVAAQHVRIDDCSNILEAVRQGLTAEARAREAIGVRTDEDHAVLGSLVDVVKGLSETIRVAKTENDRLSSDLRAEEARVSSIKHVLTMAEERQTADASYLKRQLYVHAQTLATLQGSVRPTSRRKDTAAASSDSDQINQRQFDSFYLAFENQFRGTRAEIKERVSVYVPLIKKAKAGTRQTPLIDLGCGRGEWLEVLRDEGLFARGIDLNEFMVLECAERQLQAVQADVIPHLATLDSDSLGALTAFHLIEHLSFDVLAALFAESLRVLRPGGICIFETPNPGNIQVGSNRFYSDPTHLHPLPSDFTKFLMSTTGFKGVEVMPLHPDSHAVPLTDNAAPFDRFAHEMFFGAQDYAVIGRK